MLALQAARDAGARTALVTHRPDGATAAPAELVVTTPVADRSWCHTIAYTSAILAGAALAEELAPQGLDAGAVQARLTGSSSRPPHRPAPRRRSSPAARRW